MRPFNFILNFNLLSYLSYMMDGQFFKVSTEAVYRRLSLIFNDKFSIIDKPFILLIGQE